MAKQVSKGGRSSGPKSESPSVEAIVEQDITSWTETIVRRVVEDIEPTIVAGIRARIAEIATRVNQPQEGEPGETETESAWIGIDSLSRLRGHVGGRFQNLKERWLGAGFPLKDHRGDKLEVITLDPLGWLELVSWLSRQGFEARAVDATKGFYFEIKGS